MRDDDPVSDPAAELGATNEPAPPLTARSITLAVSVTVTALLVGVAMLVPTPYAVTSPGPTFNTLGDVKGKPLIDVVGAPSYDSKGQLRFTTVQLAGGPGFDVTLPRLLEGWLDGAQTVSPAEVYFPPDVTQEQVDAANAQEMTTSQEDATVAALEELGYSVPATLTIADTVDGSGAAGALRKDDVLVALDGTPIPGYAELTAFMDAVTAGAVVQVTVQRDGAETVVPVTTTADRSGRALLGVLIDPTFHLPVDVRIQIEDVGGPSAGTMFALGIINELTQPDETGGNVIAGTGTMALDGEVGEIGGIRQKMLGARHDGAQWFLAPVANCGDVVGNEPGGLDVVAVATLHEARQAVEAIGRGDGGTLRTCEDVVGQG